MRELQDARDQYAELYELAPFGYVTLDDQGIIRTANVVAADTLGVDCERLSGRRLAEFVASSDQDVLQRLLSEPPGAADPQIHHVCLRSADGLARSVRMRCVAARDADGRRCGWRVAFVNGAERGADADEALGRSEQRCRRLEEQLRRSQRLEVIGTLAAGVAHDFNNSLMAIMGYAEVLRLALPAGHRALQDVEGIVSTTEQVAGVTKALLAFSEKTVPETAPVNLGRLVSDAMKILRRMLPAAIELSVVASESDELWVDGDAARLNQMLMGLVVNARDAMPDGGQFRIAVRHELGDRADAWAAIESRGLGVVELIVEDNGRGMSAETRGEVREPLFTTKARALGTSGSMAIVHGIVESHQGRMRIESEKGRGTCVTIALPRSEPPAEKRATAMPLEPGEGHDRTILVAEDSGQVRALIATALESSGYTVVEAADGLEAMRLFESQAEDIALAIMDIDMPKMSGQTCMEQLHGRRPDLPVILITGFCDTTIAVDESHNVLLLRKPYSLFELTRLVGERLTKVDQTGG